MSRLYKTRLDRLEERLTQGRERVTFTWEGTPEDTEPMRPDETRIRFVWRAATDAPEAEEVNRHESR